MNEVDSSLEKAQQARAQERRAADLDLAALNLSGLAHLCRQATDRYFQQLAHDDRACMELFRRAIVEQEVDAWSILMEQYSGLVRAWIFRHPSSSLADEDQDYFLNRTFDNFWYAFSRNPDKFAKFSSLKALLQYLKLCTYTAVQEYVERQMHPQHSLLADQPAESLAVSSDPILAVDNHLMASIIWQHITALVKNKRERIVAEAYFLYDMKPREIYAKNQNMFTSVVQVSRVKGNLLARLRRDKRLLTMLKDFG